MKPQPVTSPTFGIYKFTKPKHYGYQVTGKLKDYKLDIYVATDNDKIKHKLYYLTKAGEWLKSKLVYYKNNKPCEVIRCENTNMARATGDKFNS